MNNRNFLSRHACTGVLLAPMLIYFPQANVAAVELTDVNPVRSMNGEATSEQSLAVTTIALALALFRDPAGSPLYD